ncbi:phospholipase A and acyltransferase 3-like [Platichthys flesus]|uniref:phospholipase A and acyltransferase 3-like n=1 Tax=Platichthys flesus TaxID=8260 RepID=UPI002DBC9B3A|nr:phospholipase A and acyltransferase 3-like [Platichthys flesus]
MAQTFNGKPGDLIEINRGLYQHWAVYIGKNEVVHFTTDGGQSSGSSANLGSSSNGIVKRENFTNVVGHHHYQVNNLLDNSRTARDPSIIVMEACEMVGREPKYDLVSYNSEHFATEMRYGEAVSQQCKGNKGDLIEIFRDGPYQHWAVYIGGQEVVHFGTEGGLSSGSSANLGRCKGYVLQEKFSKVVGSHHFKVNNLLDKNYKPRDPSIIVKEALERVGNMLTYDLVSYNCEHFANEMRYGKPESRQVQELVKAGLVSIFGFSAVGTSALYLAK